MPKTVKSTKKTNTVQLNQLNQLNQLEPLNQFYLQNLTDNFGPLAKEISPNECQYFRADQVVIGFTDQIMFRQTALNVNNFNIPISPAPRAEYRWKLETLVPEKSFILKPKAIETQNQLIFLRLKIMSLEFTSLLLIFTDWH
ncbi:MAG TPA: hypothetical protein PKY82_28485 [Pyrinomonadaceae bacterium]|nr:hypothetical protein [Pyrinomonadaceae bacterium]